MRIRMIHLLHHGLDIIIWGMEGSCLGTGIIPRQSSSIIPMLPLQNGIIMVAMLIWTIESSKNFFDSKGHIRHHQHLPHQGNHWTQWWTLQGVLAGSNSLLLGLIMFIQRWGSHRHITKLWCIWCVQTFVKSKSWLTGGAFWTYGFKWSNFDW